MSNKGMIIRECEHLNSARRVLEPHHYEIVRLRA